MDGSSAPVFPWAALARPSWIVALVVLAMNDWFLKGAGLLPGALTGKLSDLAGLYVAPILLASVIGVRTRRGAGLVSVAVGLFFATLQTAYGAWFVGLVTSWVGLPWTVWPDPWDLLALPVLGLAFASMTRTPMSAPRDERDRVTPRRAVLASVACLLCAGTSYLPPKHPHPSAETLVDVQLHNVLARTVQARVESVATDVELDCDRVLRHPSAAVAALERGDAIAAGPLYRFEPRTNWPLWDRERGLVDRPCYLVRLVVQGRAWWIAWRHGEPPLRRRPWRSSRPPPGALRLMEIDGKLALLGAPDIRVEPL